MAIPRLYRLAQRTIVTSAGAAAWEIIAPTTAKIRVLELDVSQVAATAGVYGIGKPAAIGVTPTSPVGFLSDKSGLAAATTAGAVAWATPPTVPAAFVHRFACPASIGAGASLKFGDFGNEKGIEIAAGGSLVLWVIATAPVCDVAALIEAFV